MLNELRPDEEQSERRTPLREVALVSSNEQEHTALLEAAGYSCLPVANTSVLSPATGLPVVIDLGGADIRRRSTGSYVQLLIGLWGTHSTANRSRAPDRAACARVVAFACLYFILSAWRWRSRSASWPGGSSVVTRSARKRLQGARTAHGLLVGVPHALGDADPRRPVLAQRDGRSVRRHACSKLGLANGSCSYHLVVRAARKLDATGLGEVAAFRKQLGYELVPFLMWLDEPPGLTPCACRDCRRS